MSSKNKSFLCKNIYGVIDRIDRVGDIKLPDYDKRVDLMILKALSILFWHGFSLDEIISLKKSALQSGEGFYFIETDTRKTFLSKDEFHIIKYVAETEMHRGFPGGQLREYPVSEYIIRQFHSTTKSPTANKQFISNVFRRFNDEVKKVFIIKPADLRKNALFLDIMEQTNEIYPRKTIKKVFGYSDKAVGNLVKEYANWIKTCYPEILDK